MPPPLSDVIWFFDYVLLRIRCSMVWKFYLECTAQMQFLYLHLTRLYNSPYSVFFLYFLKLFIDHLDLQLRIGSKNKAFLHKKNTNPWKELFKLKHSCFFIWKTALSWLTFNSERFTFDRKIIYNYNLYPDIV